MLRLKSLITEKQPDAAYVAAKALQEQVKKFLSLHGEYLRSFPDITRDVANLYTATNKIVTILNREVFHSQPGES